MELLTQPHLQLSDSEDAQTTAILIPELDKELKISNSESKTTTPHEKTEEKQRIFVSEKVSKVPKSPRELIVQCETPTPNEKTEEKERILVPKNGSIDRSKVPKSPAKVNLECKTPIQRVKMGGIELPKNGTPNRLKLPVAFKYPERYSCFKLRL